MKFLLDQGLPRSTVRHLQEIRRQLVGQNGANPETVPLNLILDYPVEWSRYKVLRDLLQNFYDAVGYRAWQERFSYSHDDGALYLQAADVGFSYDWLVPIGASTKRQRPGEYAGFFGEGFKIASLCAVRDYDWEVEMASRDWELHVVIKDSKIDGCKVPSLAYHLWKRPPTARRYRARAAPVFGYGDIGRSGVGGRSTRSFWWPTKSNVAIPLIRPAADAVGTEGILPPA